MTYSTHDRSHFNSLVEQLRRKLRNFTAVNLQGDRIGIVKDLVVDSQRQLQVVISTVASGLSSPRQLNSKQIKKIELADKVVVVDCQPIDSVSLPENLNLFEHNGSAVGDRVDSLPDRSSSSMTSPSSTSSMETKDNELTESQSTEAREIEAAVLQLLAERVVVERQKRKVGEVVVRKEIATRIVEVPVRYEKLIVEQVSPERQQIAEIELGSETISGSDKNTPALAGNRAALTVSGRFHSPKIASSLLSAIARERQHGCQEIRVELVVDSAERQNLYQEWFDRCSIAESPK